MAGHSSAVKIINSSIINIIIHLIYLKVDWASQGAQRKRIYRSMQEIQLDPWEVGNGYPLQYSSLENSMDRGAWRAIVHRVAKSWT